MTQAIFEYMIGNTDWSVYANHNTNRQDLISKVFCCSGRFDFSDSGCTLCTGSFVRPETLTVNDFKEIGTK